MRMQRLLPFGLAVVVSAPMWLGGSTMDTVQAQGQKEAFTAFAVNMSGRGPSTATVDITIERWTTDAERAKLLATLQADGPKALLSALQNMPRAGNIRTPDRIGYDLRYARQNPGEDGGRQIVVVTDRPIGFWEARNQPRTIDYPFTLAELRLNKENRGEGKLSIATKITIRNDNLVLENYDIQPVQLNEIRKLN
jgi:hypothetical protein